MLIYKSYAFITLYAMDEICLVLFIKFLYQYFFQSSMWMSGTYCTSKF